MNSTLPQDLLSNVFVTAGQMGERIRDFDWSDSLLGPIEKWPQSLRSALSICLNSNFPIAIYWGYDLVLLYNDAWSPIPGNKHPWALGKPALEVWPEIWPDIEPQFKKAFTGIPGGSIDALLPMQRHGYTEECYFDFTFTPIYGESGKVEGIFNAVIETTYRVINERRAGVLQKLSDAVNAIVSGPEVFSRAGEILGNAKKDLPFYFIYEITPDKKTIHRGGSISGNEDAAWPVQDVINTGTGSVIDNVDSYLKKIPDSYWPEPTTQAYLVPLKANDGTAFGFIVCGISARRKFDKDYKSFFDSIANIIGGELNTIRSLNQEKERAESLAQIDRAKTIFFSNISHEFRTPLTLILGPLGDLMNQQDKLAPEITEQLSVSYRNTLRLQKLVNTLLDFSRIEAGKMEAKFSETDIGHLTADLASSFRSAIESAGIAYSVSIQKINHPVFIDVDMWEKIVLNLISNAFKYTQHGKISVIVKEAAEKIIFSVEDTGIGIKEEDQKKIFERFYRVNHAGGRSQEGTGIGLALVRELVHLHKGEIEVESEYGRGTKFTVTIPEKNITLQKENAGSNIGVNQHARSAFVEEARKWSDDDLTTVKEGVRQDKRPRILIADDNRDMHEYLQRLLSADYTITSVSNGEDAFSLALSQTPDLILSDIMMPKVDGFELLKKLKSCIPTRNIPFIFLSARAGEEARVQGIQAGADDYLVKPFSSKELLARISNHILINKIRSRTEKEFYNLFLQSPAHIHIMRGPDHLVEFFHPLGRPFVGGRDITGMKIREAVPEIEGQGYFEMLDQVYHEGKSFFLPDAKATLLKNGKAEDYYFNTTYLPWRDLEGRIQGVLQFTFDVTEQAKANQKIKESEERFKLLATSIPQIVWIANPQGDTEYLSDQWEQYTGESAAAGMHDLNDLIHPDDLAEVMARWKSAMRDKKPWSAEYRLEDRRSGTYTWFYGKMLPLLDDSGELMKWVGSATDIHRLKEQSNWLEGQISERTNELRLMNESLKRSNEELQQFAYIASHDLQEPLRKIQIFSGMVKDHSDDKEFIENYLTKIDKSAARMSALIKDVLLFSQVTKGKKQDEKVSLQNILEGVKTDFELLINQKNAQIFSDDLPEVIGNKLQLHQLLSNLISNALKFSEADPVIRIACKVVKPADVGETNLHSSQYYKIDITDNGIGFDPAYSQQIFGLFNRLHNRKDFSGTGIGLALCKKIMENHQGIIKASSTPGEGSTFTIYLPLR